MDYLGNSFKVNIVGNYKYVTVTTEKLKTGIYEINFDDSNEDELVIDLEPIKQVA